MCGIAGVVHNGQISQRDNLQAMLQAIRHRGPDSSSTYHFDTCALGHQRLSIVDLSTGDQPMHGVNNTALVFNGEIYGYKDIRSTLAGAYSFKTTSDTEVILALYQRYGSRLPVYLPGMFAFALWDEESKQLFCARDRFGEKPFYYARGRQGEFIFASELKAIVRSGLIDPVLDERALAHYLRKLYVPVTQTIYKNIFTLPPAHTLLFKAGEVTINRYWELPAPLKRIQQQEAEEQFAHLLKESVRKQLVADVPVGAFLSGGLDSGSVVALASSFHPGPIKTFSFGFNGERNELDDARLVAKRYGTEHVEFVEDDYHMADLLVTMNTVYDEPFADSSNIPMYLISKFAATQLKVVLTGDGGDELLGGYSDWYGKVIRTITQFESTRNRRKILSRILPGFVKTKSSRLRTAEVLLQQFDTGILAESIHQNQNTFFSSKHLTALGLPQPNPVSYYTNRTNTVDDAMRMDLQDYLPGDILVKGDRASMASSLELRCPFLDVALAEFCISLPWELKLDAQVGKKLLRATVKDLLPPTHFTQKKRGFGSPVRKWLDKPDVVRLKLDTVLDRQNPMYNYLDFDTTQRLMLDNDYKAWALLNLAIWFKQH